MREHEIEPVPGLPERLPPGERLLWQGAPQWRALARRALRLRVIALYFGLLLAGQLALGVVAGTPGPELATALALSAGLALAAIGLILLFARLVARSTLYTLTDRRVVMRFGVALPVTLNLPFKVIEAASLRDDGATGEIALKVARDTRLSLFVLWPHARPWRLLSPQPALRAIADAPAVARLLSEALAAEAATRPAAAAPRVADPVRPEPAREARPLAAAA